MKQLSGVNIQYLCMNGMRADTVLQCWHDFLLFPLYFPFVFSFCFPLDCPFCLFLLCVFMPGDGFVCACVCVSHCVRWVWLQALQLLDQTAHLRRIFSRDPTGQLSPLLRSKMFHLSCRTCGYSQLSGLCFVYFELLVTHLSCVLLPALVHHTSPPLQPFSSVCNCRQPTKAICHSPQFLLLLQ